MNNDLLFLASRIILANAKGDEKALEQIRKELEAPVFSSRKNPDFIAFVKFTPKEIKQMPEHFQNVFRAEGCTVCYRRRKRGNCVDYEARYRRNGYNISVSAREVPDLKKKFIAALHGENKKEATVPDNFHEFTMYYFENFRKRKVTPTTLMNDTYRYNKHIKPSLGKKSIKRITPGDCQKLINEIEAGDSSKTSKEVYSLLNVIFKMAIAHQLITFNPLGVVIHTEHENTHGVALSKTEEKKLLSAVAGTPYEIMFAVALWTGMRPNEYKTAVINGDFIVAVNSKRKGKRIEYKKIPICPMLRPFLEGVKTLQFYSLDCIRDKMRGVLPDHRLYDLRTTFYTRCHECGVADVARMEFVGHSLGKLGNAYTDLSDEFLIQEAQKIKY